MSKKNTKEVKTLVKAKNKKTRGLIIMICAIVLMLVIIIAANLVSAAKKKSGGPGAMPGMPSMSAENINKVYTVRSQAAQVESLTDFVITSGEVETQTSVEVFPEIGGRIVQVNVNLGSHVNKGDVIARVDASEAGTYYAQSPVVAPISGSVLLSPVKAGTKVSLSSVITKIGDVENLQITAKIPERYVGELKTGLRAEISLQAYPDAVFGAYVTRVSPVLDASSRTKEIILNFDKKDSRINAGMFAKVKLYTSTYKGKIVIPQDAVVTQNDDTYVFVVKEDNTVTKRTVTLGKTVDGKTQIASGVESGETVVVEGMLSLFEGAKVHDLSNPEQNEAQADLGNMTEEKSQEVKE